MDTVYTSRRLHWAFILVLDDHFFLMTHAKLRVNMDWVAGRLERPAKGDIL